MYVYVHTYVRMLEHYVSKHVIYVRNACTVHIIAYKLMISQACDRARSIVVSLISHVIRIG